MALLQWHITNLILHCQAKPSCLECTDEVLEVVLMQRKKENYAEKGGTPFLHTVLMQQDVAADPLP